MDTKRPYRDIIDTQTTLVCRFLPDGTLTFINNAYSIYFGKNHDELIGHSFMSFLDKDEQDKVQRLISSLNPEKPITIHNCRLLADNGQTCWLQLVIQAIFDEEGNLTEFQVEGQDITERKQAEEELRQSEERYRSLISNIPDLVWTTDEKWYVVFVGPNAESVLGYTQEEIYQWAHWMEWYDRVHPDDVDRAKAAFRALVEKGKHYDIEYRFKRKDGRWIWLHDRSVGTYERRGRRYADGLATDITERKQAEEERKKLQERAQLNSRLACIGQMAAGVAHEINNPLTSVIGLTEAIMQKDIPIDVKEDLQVVHNGAQRITSIVSRLLTFARQQKTERTYIYLNEVIRNTIALRAYALKTSNIKVKTQLAPDLPRTLAAAGQLQQVFLNIILNAETAMKSAHGKGDLIIKTEKINNAIRVSFEDDGPGIAKEDLDKLFEPFFTTKAVGQGTGLGLSVCHGIITAHNGQIYVNSQLGKGATFIVELPIVVNRKQKM